MNHMQRWMVATSLALSLNAQAEFISPRTYQAALLAGVPETALKQTSDYLEKNAAFFPNKRFVSIVDFTRHSGDKRFFILDLEREEATALFTAHGKNSDRDNNGYATEFSNTPESKKSSLGFFKVAERYNGQHGLSVRMDGLEKRNNKARERAIVIHGADYVNGSRSQMGRSWGCPAVEQKVIKGLVEKLEQGSLFYAYIEGIDPNADDPIPGKEKYQAQQSRWLDESNAPAQGE